MVGPATRTMTIATDSEVEATTGGHPGEVTELLLAWAEGSPFASDRLFSRVYTDLRALARSCLGRQSMRSSLEPTALVHEAYLRLTAGDGPSLRDRKHFFAVAAQAMRWILVDRARRELAGKRIPRDKTVAIDGGLELSSPTPVDTVELDQALRRLEQIDAQLVRIVELRYFVGLTLAETAATLELSSATVSRDWQVARAWLRRELGTAAGR